MTRPPVIIDCDTGRDDALSLWLALSLNIPLAGVVASYGNTTLDNVVDNTARVLSLAGRNDIPLFAGCAAPVKSHRAFNDIVLPRQAVAGNGLCNINLPSAARALPQASALPDLAMAIKGIADVQGKIDYVILGPATNFAAICRILGDSVHEAVNSVTMMGGKLDDLWSQMPGADFNLACDPYSVHEVLQSGLPVRFVPMNFTWPIYLHLPEIEALQPQSEIARTAQSLMIAHARYFAPEPVFRFHDPCVILTLCDDEGFIPRKMAIDLDESSADFGRLIRIDHGFPVHVYEGTENKRLSFRSQILEALGLASA